MPTNEETLKEFARWVIQHIFDGLDVDGADVQDKAEELGLLEEVPYDPAVHRSVEDVDAGDPICIFTDKLK